MKKALVFLVTIIAVILTLALTVSAEDVIQRGTWGDLEWELNETTGALTISGEGKMNSLHGDDDAWKVYKYKIKSVSIENGVTSIGQGSFQECEYLTDIRISRTVNSIGNFAFYKCKSLSNVLIPDSITNIGEYAFTKCASLEEVVLPNSVHSIGRNAFSDCSNLEKVTIPYGVLKIEDFTFDNCSKLTTVNLPNSISSIGNRAFRDCRLENVVLPKYINEIGEYAFDSCNFSVIEIPNSVIHIGEYAFWCNYSLKTVYIHSYTFISHMISFSTSVQDAKTIVVPKDAAVTEYILKRYTFDCDCLIDGKEYSVYSDHDHIWDSDNCLEGTTCQSCYLSVDMISHDYKDATCTEPKTCRYCEKTEGEATGHKYFNHASIDATCTNDKIQAVLCSVCQHIEPIIIEGTKLGHDFADATCIDPKTCKRDGCTVTEGNALGHDFADATCTDPKTCKRDGCTVTEGVALGHSFTNYVSDNNATCLTDGTKTAKCDRCDETDTVADEGSALGHDFADATCTAPKTCKRDGCTVTEGNALGHSFTNYVSNNDATCLTDGTKTAKCDRCDAKDTVTDANTKFGHDFADATCTEPKTCKRDGCTATDGAALGHTYDNSCDGDCNVCNEARTPSSHVWDGGVITKEPTKDEEGVKTYTCTVCGETKTESVPKLTGGCGGGDGALFAIMTNSAIALVWFALKKKH